MAAENGVVEMNARQLALFDAVRKGNLVSLKDGLTEVGGKLISGDRVNAIAG
jgi:hypothetical protein